MVTIQHQSLAGLGHGLDGLATIGLANPAVAVLSPLPSQSPTLGISGENMVLLIAAAPCAVADCGPSDRACGGC